MKLRNKKTGQIGDLIGSERSCPYITIGVDFHDGNPRSFDYTTLDQLNEDWEDYKLAEPLITDEMVRKIIKKWFNENKIVGKLRSYGSGSWLGLRGTDEADCDWKIELRVSYISLLEYDKLYSLAELIGEEEECES